MMGTKGFNTAFADAVGGVTAMLEVVVASTEAIAEEREPTREWASSVELICEYIKNVLELASRHGIDPDTIYRMGTNDTFAEALKFMTENEDISIADLVEKIREERAD